MLEQILPKADVYEKEFVFMPWARLIKEVTSYLVTHMPRQASVLDFMCGIGHLLGKLQEQRPDGEYIGVDHSRGFISYAKKRYSKIAFVREDVFLWQPPKKFDVVVCTGGVHHLEDQYQRSFLNLISHTIRHDGFAIIADPYIGDYRSERGRQIASVRLGCEYLIEVIKKGGPLDVVEAAVQILRNDVLLSEWKTSIKRRRAMLEQHFGHIEVYKTWPRQKTDYGDYYFVVRN